MAFIRTEFGRGYRFTAAAVRLPAWSVCARPVRRRRRSSRTLGRRGFFDGRIKNPLSMQPHAKDAAR
jgi:hypothetical protein